MVNRSLAGGDWATYVSYVDALLCRRHHVPGLVLLHEMARSPVYYTGMRASIIRDNCLEVGFAHLLLYGFRLFLSPATKSQSADRSFENNRCLLKPSASMLSIAECCVLHSNLWTRDKRLPAIKKRQA